MVLDVLEKSLKSKKDTNLIILFLIVLAGFALLNLGFAADVTNSTRMTVFVTNTAPVVIFANVTPNPALPAQTLTYRANISDVNADTIKANITYYNTTSDNRSGLIALWYDGTWYTNSTFTLPAGADPGTWYVNATISDGFTTIVNKTIFTVQQLTATTLQDTPIDFGNQTVGEVAQRAENGTAVSGEYTANVRGFPLVINNTGNTRTNYTVNGSNLVGPTETIGVANVTWNVTDTGSGSRAGKVALATTHISVATAVVSGDNRSVFFWIDIPSGISQERLNGTVYIETNSEN